ncbi:MAG: outer membrane beta-barrel protein [Bradyrhizobium sp.]
MKRTFIACVAAVAVWSAPAHAADPGWTGFYIGANGGYGWNSASISDAPGDQNTNYVFLGQPNVASSSASFDGTGWLGGVQAGYNWHLNQRWLAGVEADFDWSDIGGNGSAPTVIFLGNNPATLNVSQKVEWFGTLRARVGYLASADLLLFATGGLAYGKVNESASIVLPPGVANSQGNFGTGYACGGVYGDSTCFAGAGSRTSAGWTAGAGAEYRFSQHATVKLEYLYVNLGSNTFLVPAAHAGALSPSVLNASGEAAFNLVRVGLNYRF